MHKTFGIIKDFLDHQNLSRLSGNFPDYLETSQTILTLSRLSGNLPDYPETFQTIRKLSRPSTSQCDFEDYTQKPSGRARMFRMAIPRYHNGFCETLNIKKVSVIVHVLFLVGSCVLVDRNLNWIWIKI